MTERAVEQGLDVNHLIETRQLFNIGELPPPGEIPTYMHAQLIRQSRYGRPETAFQEEIVKSPRPEDLKPNEVIIAPMAAGLNYNNIFATLGKPMDFVKYHKRKDDAGDEEGFHIGGSDASGIVYAIGSDVKNVKVGDHVVAHCAMWDEQDPRLKEGTDPSELESFTVWGLDENWGSLAQFSKLQAHQLMPKAEHLTWEEAAVLTLDGATAYKMLRSWPPNTVGKDDVVLIWGGSGGLGYLAIQLVKHFGGRPVAVVSSDEKGEWCKKIGAIGYIDRTKFDHWKKASPDPNDRDSYDQWLIHGPRQFEKALIPIIGRDKPKIVFEYTGQDTLPTSAHVCAPKGMVVICAGLTGYKVELDLLRFWTKQLRLEGSHVFNDEEAKAFNDLVRQEKIQPYLSPKSVLPFDKTGLAHQQLFDNNRDPGKLAVLVNSPQAGLGII